jgi:hypothetical protein
MPTCIQLFGRGLIRTEPTIDWRPAQKHIPDATPDSEVLQLATDDERVLVSRDAKTMPHHFAAFVKTRSSAGVVLIPTSLTIGAAIEELFTLWLSWSAEDIENQLWWLPN